MRWHMERAWTRCPADRPAVTQHVGAWPVLLALHCELRPLDAKGTVSTVQQMCIRVSLQRPCECVTVFPTSINATDRAGSALRGGGSILCVRPLLTGGRRGVTPWG